MNRWVIFWGFIGPYNAHCRYHCDEAIYQYSAHPHYDYWKMFGVTQHTALRQPYKYSLGVTAL